MAPTIDSSAQVRLEPGEVLRDDQRVKRLIAALSRGIFYTIDDTKASEILLECLKICGDSKDTLSQVLQNEFFAGHTPFYWAITNIGLQSPASPLLNELLLYGEPLGHGAQNDIVAAFRLQFNSVLYDSIRNRLTLVETIQTYSPSFFHSGEDIPVLTVSSRGESKSTVWFSIPRFLDRLAVDTKLSIQFYALDATFCLTAAMIKDTGVRPRWAFNLSDISTSGPKSSSTEATLEITRALARWNYSLRPSGSRPTGSILEMPIHNADLAGLYPTLCTANERGVLSGTITLSKC